MGRLDGAVALVVGQVELDDTVRPLVEAQLVAEIDELHRRLQQVITIRAAADDVQTEIQLGRRENRKRFHSK